jgi:hypothetical protein
MDKITENINLNFIGKNNKKKQIVLANTKRNLHDYISNLKYRLNGKFDRLPHFIISKSGEIIRTLPDKAYSNYFSKESVNKNSIVIVLENLGWLEKIPLSNKYINWINDIYIGEIYERKWRDYFFWEPYTDEQIKSCAELCVFLSSKYSINKRCVGHNTKVDGVERFEGITSKSNFDSKFTDLSPAFDFEKFLKYIENEQLV